MIFTGRGKRKNEDRTYGNSSFYLITDVKKHDFVCSFFLCVILADSSTPTSTYSFKHIAILQMEHTVTDREFPRPSQLQGEGEGTRLLFGHFLS